MFILALLVPVVAILLIYLFDRINKLQSRLDHLEKLLLLIRNGQQADTVGATTPQLRDVAPPPPAMPRAVPPIAPTAPRASSRSRQEWEALVGGKLLNRIGALALVIGVGFFLKYAFDNNWISEPVRVLVGATVGAALLALGAYTNRKDFQVFSQGLVGAGIAILYLTVYASFNFYHLVSQPAAFVAMSVVTGIAFWQAKRYDASAVALLAWAGGFLTPFLLATDRPNAVGLFGYLTLLNIAVLAITSRKGSWRIVSLLTLVGAHFTYTIWYISHGREDAYAPALIFLTVTWALFFASDMYLSRRSQYSTLAAVQSSLNVFLWVCLTIILLDSTNHDWHAAVFVAAAVVYGLSAFQLERIESVSRMLVGLTEFYGIALLATATYYQFGPFSRIAVWGAEAAALCWFGLATKRSAIWKAALGLFSLAILMLLANPNALGYRNIETYRLILNFRSLAYLALALSLIVAAKHFQKYNEIVEQDAIAGILTSAWFLVLFGFITVETSDYFRHQMSIYVDVTEHYAFARSLMLMSLWAGYGVVLLWLALEQKNSMMIACASLVLFLSGIASLFAFSYRPIEDFRLILNLRVLAFLLVAAAYYFFGRWLRSSSAPALVQKSLGIASQTMLMLLLLVLITAETWDAFGFSRARLAATSEPDSTALNNLQDLRQLTLSGVWLVYSVILMVMGLWRRVQMLRIAAIGLFGLTILKIFIYDLSFLDTLYRIFSFIGLGLILLAVSYAYQRYKGIILN